MGDTATLPADDTPREIVVGGLPLNELRSRLERPPIVRVLHNQHQVVVWEPGLLTLYELGQRKSRGFGWLAHAAQSGHGPVEAAVKTSEVMAAARDGGHDDDVAQITLTAADAITTEPPDDGPDPAAEYGAEAYKRPSARKRLADRLRQEVEDGRNFTHISTRPIRVAIAKRLAAGEDIATLCRRAGFTGRQGVDTSWLQRRAGLLPDSCSKTGKQRLARVAHHDVYARLIRAVDGDPVDFEDTAPDTGEKPPRLTGITGGRAGEHDSTAAAITSRPSRELLSHYTDPAGIKHTVELVSGDHGALVIDRTARRVPRLIARLAGDEGRPQAEAALAGTPADPADRDQKGAIAGYIERARLSARPLCRRVCHDDLTVLGTALKEAA